MVSDLVQPLNSGNDDRHRADDAKMVVSGIRFHKPPNSLALAVPVR